MSVIHRPRQLYDHLWRLGSHQEGEDEMKWLLTILVAVVVLWAVLSLMLTAVRTVAFFA